MNKLVSDLKAESEVSADPLALLRAPFQPNQISKLPKPLAKREEMDKLPKAKCAECGGYHATSKIIHLDYVGHAALTDRLLDTDPAWSWEPLAFRDGLPAFDATGGLWIKLTVCSVTRLGYGHAAQKPQMDPGAREKEVIGDALRNAAMRFGAALDLWHKGDLHAPEDEPAAPSMEEKAITLLRGASADRGLFKEAWEKNFPGWKKAMDRDAYNRVVKVMHDIATSFPKDEPPPPPPPAADDFGIGADEIPF